MIYLFLCSILNFFVVSIYNIIVAASCICVSCSAHVAHVRTSLAACLDEHFDDARMAKVYPKAVHVESGGESLA